MTSDNVKLDQMNTDVLCKIFEEVTIQNRDEIAIFKEKYNKHIIHKGYSDRDFNNLEFDSAFEDMEDWIGDYVSSLKQRQINSILCDYGINKALLLLHDFHKIGMGDTADDICEVIEICQTEETMVQLVLSDAVNFHTIWRRNSD